MDKNKSIDILTGIIETLMYILFLPFIIAAMVGILAGAIIAAVIGTLSIPGYLMFKLKDKLKKWII
jgi:uncharacterized SAM-binding protein YcdF (DUF218 family)